MTGFILASPLWQMFIITEKKCCKFSREFKRGKRHIAINFERFLLNVTWWSALESVLATCCDLVSSGESSDVNPLTPNRSCWDYWVIWLMVKWKGTQKGEKNFQRMFSGLKEIRWVLWLFYHFLMPVYLRCVQRNLALAVAVPEFTREF